MRTVIIAEQRWPSERTNFGKDGRMESICFSVYKGHRLKQLSDVVWKSFQALALLLGKHKEYL
jgi:hypothetical protein